MADEEEAQGARSIRKRGAGMPRSQSMVLAGYFLSRLTEIDGSPPAVLGVQHWREAYELFRPSCGEGREATSFARSLKNTRDAFDSHLDGTRVGWRDANGGPGRLSTVEAHVRDTWTSRSDVDLTEAVEELLTRPVDVARVGSGQPGQGGTRKLATGVVLVRSGARAPADEIHLKSPRRAGREKQIGDAAEALVRDHLMEMLGPAAATLIHHAALGETPGYDLSFVRDGIHHCVEVKGTVGTSMASFVITRKEWAAAEEVGSRYHLYLVSGVEGATPVLQVLTDPSSSGAQLAREPLAWQVRVR